MSDEGRQPQDVPPPMPPYDPAQWSPQPPPPGPAPRRGRKALIIIGMIVLALAVLGAGGYMLIKGVMKGAEKLGAQVAEPILVQLRDGQYDAIYNDASPEFKKATTKAQLDSFLKGMENAVGRPQSWKLVGYKTEAYAGTGGATTIKSFTYDVTHQHGATQIMIQTVGTENRLLYINVNSRPK